MALMVYWENFKSGVHFAVRWILRFLVPIFFFQIAHQTFKWQIKILLLHANERDMGHWPSLIAHPYYVTEITMNYEYSTFKKIVK